MTSERRSNPIRDLPLPTLYLVIAAIWIVFQLVFHTGAITPITVITTVIGGLLFSAVLTAIAAASRRRLGGASQVSAFNHALRTGTPAPGEDTAHWPAELDRLDQTRLRRTLLPIAASALPIGLGIWGLTDPDARPIAIVLLLVFIALDVAALALLPLQRRRVARLRHNLTTR